MSTVKRVELIHDEGTPYVITADGVRTFEVSSDFLPYPAQAAIEVGLGIPPAGHADEQEEDV